MEKPPITTPTTFSLSRATPQDVPCLARIAALAFEHDANTQVKAAARAPGAFEHGMAEGLRQWMIAGPERCAVLKATDDRDGTVAGGIMWGFRGVPVGDLPESSSYAPDDGGGGVSIAPPDVQLGPASGGENARTSDVAEEEEEEGAKRIAHLEDMTSKHLAEFQERIMPEGTRCMYIGSLVVDPQYHGMGVGSMLVGWGTEQADRAGVFCWVHSSEAGWGMFAKHGFGEVDHLTVDLDEWAVGPPGDGLEAVVVDGGDGGEAERGRSWGKYTFRYMVRQARASP